MSVPANKSKLLDLSSSEPRDITSPGSKIRARIKRAAPALLLWLFGLVNLLHPVLFSLNSGDGGDTRLNLYFLEHQFKVLTDSHYPGHFATAPFWFPESANDMARSDMLTGAAPFYILPRLFLPRDAAYEAFFAIAGTLNFLALYWILRRLEVQAPVAALAAFVFAFGMHKVQHTVHSQLFLQCWGVLCLYCVVRFLQSPTRGLVFGAVLLLGLQTLSSPYCGIFYLIGAGLLIGIYAAIARGTVGKTLAWCRREFLAMAGAATLAMAPAVVLLMPYLKSGGGVHRSWEEVSFFIPKPWLWIDPLQGTLWWFVKRLWGAAPEAHQTYFLGVVFLLLALGCGTAFWVRREWRTSVRGKVGFAFFGMSLGLLFLASDFWGHSPWNPIYRFLPGASGIRDIGRIGIVANAGLLISGALFLDFVLRRRRKSAARFLLVSCMALALAENCLLLALIPQASWRQFDTHKRFHFYDELYGTYAYPRNYYGPQMAEMAALMRGASAAYVYPDPSIADFAHENNATLVAQQVDVPVMNGDLGVAKAGYGAKMSPRQVLEKGTGFDFDGFEYLVPRSEEGRLRNSLRQAGLTFLKGGAYYAAYTPAEADRGFDADFQVIGAPPTRLLENQVTELPVVVTNRSRYPWQPFGDRPTRPAYQVLSAETQRPVSEGVRADLPAVLLPGDSALIHVPLKVATPGKYVIRLAMVQEGVAWFLPRDAARSVQFPVTVEDPETADGGCSATFDKGWYGQERAGADWWRWSSGTGEIHVSVREDSDIRMDGLLASAQPPNRVNIVLDGESQAQILTPDSAPSQIQGLALHLAKGEHVIQFLSRNAGKTFPTDTRSLAISLRNLRIQTPRRCSIQ
ncbi:MAG TPA: hypothetical protein VMH05_24880 [Bryobacteraceae bacterium]|nr:hypothetical protein [Bryobacteraceae bacterium]